MNGVLTPITRPSSKSQSRDTLSTSNVPETKLSNMSDIGGAGLAAMSSVHTNATHSSEAERARQRQTKREYEKEQIKLKGKRRGLRNIVDAADNTASRSPSPDAQSGLPTLSGLPYTRPMTAEEKAEEEKLATEEAAMQELERKFQQEMVEMELNEKWQASFNMIHANCLERYRILIQSYSVFLRIKLYKFLALFNWTEDVCEGMYHILLIASHIPDQHPAAHNLDLARKDNIGCTFKQLRHDLLFDKLLEYAEKGWESFVYKFLVSLKDPAIKELLIEMTAEEFDECVELARFLSPVELTAMYQYVDELSIREVLGSMIVVQDPFVKACRLCRLRRIDALETRLVHDQVPPKMIRVTGALAIYDKAETWAAMDEKGFTFDAEHGKILWRNNVVDLMRICDKCLQDAHGACTSDGRFDQLWSLPANIRKEAIAKLRGREQQLAAMIQTISIQRVNRRMKEWAIRAVEAQRIGQRIERERREKIELDALTAAKAKEKAEQKQSMLSQAGAVDRRWREQEEHAAAKELSVHVHTAALNYHLDYTRENPAPITREHPHSWRHAHYLPDGTPISAVGAVERFGTYTITPDEQTGQLQEWKQRAIESNEEFAARIEAFKKKQRDAELKTFEQHVEYVDKRIKRLKRQEQRLARTLELEEQARVDKRKADREARAALRWARQEAIERWNMELEDDRSHRVRFYQWECLQVDREREGMWYEEKEQCAVDRFWGFDVEDARLKAINDKYKAFYQQRIAETRKKLILSKQIRPFKIEADMKVFKNPFTGEVLK